MEEFACEVREGAAMRVDKYLADELGLVTRSQLKARLASITVNGSPAKLSRPVKGGDLVRLALEPEPDPGFAAEDIALDVLYEDADAIVVDKPQGMVSHPAHGNWNGTLANALLGRLAGASAPPRAGIVHRLDKDTSGVIVAAKTDAALEALAAQFRNRTTRKIYHAVVRGSPPADSGRIENRLARDPRDRKRFAVTDREDGRLSLTEWKVLERFPGYAFLELRPRTGRTHQLRVHMRHLGCPIVGDPIYGRPDKRFPGATLMLHASELRILLPGATEQSRFQAPLPDRFISLLAKLRSDRG